MSWLKYVATVTKSCRHPQANDKTRPTYQHGIVQLLESGFPLEELEFSDQRMIIEGLDSANFLPPLHYCKLLDEYYGKDGLLCDTTECMTCPIFHWAVKDVFWICCVCRKHGLNTSEGHPISFRVLEPFYSSGTCHVCQEESILLVPIVIEESK